MGEENYLSSSLFILSDGERKGISWDSIPSITLTEDREYISDTKKRIYFPSTVNRHIAIQTEIESPELNQILNLDKDHDFSLMIHRPVGVQQARRHKKRRINKKWAKRYGTRPIYAKLTIPCCHLRHEDGTDLYEAEIIAK